MQFSVILPTRNRPALFEQALASVLAQDGAEFEVIVVADGCDPALLGDYQPIWDGAGARLRVIHLPISPRGHGQSQWRVCCLPRRRRYLDGPGLACPAFGDHRRRVWAA